jgi:2-polyprenyl-3-methyl-5-hydroxy-6-metoxy-1,4-benzoquinol methylase
VDRSAWLGERRRAVEDAYTAEASTYDDGYDPVTDVHRRFVERLIDTTPPDGVVLDAACGTGPYVGLIRRAGRGVVGADQSAGMLAQARSNHPGVRFEKIGLQELSFDAEFDAAMCIDAMEHVPPEECSPVIANLRRAVRRGGHLYLTVEEIDRGRVDAAFVEATAAGLPVVRGEVMVGDTGGYHFYPGREQVQRWLADADLEVVADEDEHLGTYGYHHLLVARR